MCLNSVKHVLSLEQVSLSQIPIGNVTHPPVYNNIAKMEQASMNCHLIVRHCKEDDLHCSPMPSRQ